MSDAPRSLGVGAGREHNRRSFSVLSPPTALPSAGVAHDVPDHFRDLNCDQIVAAITAGWQEYDLVPFFQAPLEELDAIAYRHEVMRDLEQAAVLEAVRSFSELMRTVRSHLARAKQAHYPREKQRWFLAAVAAYTEAVQRLNQDFHDLALASRGLQASRDWLEEYVAGPAFMTLVAERRRLETELAVARYTVRIEGSAVTVGPYRGEADYSAVVAEVFAKFRRDTGEDYRSKLTSTPELNHVEAEILDRVALLYPDTFRDLERFCAERADFLDPTVARFDREVQFYVSFLSYVQRFRRAGLAFCYPELSASAKEVRVREAFDLALAHKLLGENGTVVCNDVDLRGSERIIVVSGPNQGGKTTFARMVGQVHFLASLGCMVPGREARLFACDRIFTHFERKEDITNLRGKLLDDLVRVRAILDAATPRSLVIMNEVFSSTSLADAVFLSKKVLKRLSALDVLAVCVTFLTELAALNEKTVSFTAMVDPRDPSIRTFKVKRQPADGLAHALAIAEKYGVTYERLKERIPP